MNITTALEVCRQSGYLVTSTSESIYLLLMMLFVCAGIGGGFGYILGDEL